MKTALIIIGIIVLAFIILNIIARRQMKNIPSVADNQKILTLTDKNFQNLTKNKIVLVDFWAAWCAPCRMMAPVLNELADELDGKDVAVGKVNIEQYQSLAKKYNIRSIPTMVIFKNGVEVSRFSGVRNKEYLKKQLGEVKF